MNLKLLLLFFIIVHFTGCYTMHFVRTEQSSSLNYTHSQWYHVGGLGFVEFSEPVSLITPCNGVDRWRAVRVQTDWLQALVRVIPLWLWFPDIKYRQLNISNVPIPFLINIVYSPEQVSVACLPSR